MTHALTLAEIEMQFAGEWVLVGDPQTGADLSVQGGVVLAHSKDRDEVYRRAMTLRPQRFAMLYVGTIPPNTEFAL